MAKDMLAEAEAYKRRMIAANERQRCSICDQSYTDPAGWGDESLMEIQERQGWLAEPMHFDACPDCLTVGVCPDCLHERVCCQQIMEVAAELRDTAP